MTTPVPKEPYSADKSLRSQQNRLWEAVIKRYEDGESWRYVLNLVLVIGGGALVAATKLPSFPTAAAMWLGGFGLGMIFLGGGLVGWFDKKRTDLTRHAKDSLLLAEEYSEEFSIAKATLDARIAAAAALDRRRVFLLNAIWAMQEAAERVPVALDLATVVVTMLDAGSNGLEGAIGFEAGEKWSISIFQAVAQTEAGKSQVMKRIALSCADRPPEIAAGRVWKKNEGYTGKAWQADAEEIEPDVRLPGIRERYTVPKSKDFPGDAERYVSIAVIPIRVGSSPSMWGLVTATTDHAGRWTRAASDPREQNVVAVRMLAQLIAMQVALRQK